MSRSVLCAFSNMSVRHDGRAKSADLDAARLASNFLDSDIEMMHKNAQTFY